MSFKNKYSHTPPLFKQLDILPFNSLILHKKGNFMWKLYNGLIPPTISNLFFLNTTVIGQRLNPLNYHLPNPSNESDKRSLQYSCIKLWNVDIPLEIKQCTFLRTFMKK